MGERIDFDQLKRSVSFADVLDVYGITYKRNEGGQLKARCPFHDDKTPSFSVSTEATEIPCFHCFGCGERGNVLAFVMKVEGVAVRKAAELLREYLGYETTVRAPKSSRAGAQRRTQAPEPRPVAPHRQRVNTPFSGLKNPLEAVSLAGFKDETLEHFGCGKQKRGTMAGRVMIPIHNERSELVAYAGLKDGEYKYPGEERFIRGIDWYNYHRAVASPKTWFYVVEDFRDVWKLYELGVENVLASMELEVSNEQEELLKETSDKVKALVFLVGEERFDTAGVVERFIDTFFIKIITIETPVYKLENLPA